MPSPRHARPNNIGFQMPTPGHAGPNDIGFQMSLQAEPKVMSPKINMSNLTY